MDTLGVIYPKVVGDHCFVGMDRSGIEKKKGKRGCTWDPVVRMRGSRSSMLQLPQSCASCRRGREPLTAAASGS